MNPLSGHADLRENGRGKKLGRGVQLTVRAASITTALVAMWFGMLAAASPATAVECGTAGYPPCAAHRSNPPKPAAPKPAAPQHNAAPQHHAPQRAATPRHYETPPAPARSSGGSLGTAAGVLSGVGDLLSTIQEMTPPEPEPDEAVSEPDVEVEAAPPAPPPVQPRRRGADPNLVRAARKDLEMLRHSDVPRSDYRTVLFSKYPADVVNAVMP